MLCWVLCCVLCCLRRVLAPGDEYQIGEEDMFDGLVDLNSDNFRRAETSGVSVTNASTDD